MKTKLALLLALTLAVQLHAALINYEFGGTITGTRFLNLPSDLGISIGDRFTFSLTIDDGATDRYVPPVDANNSVGRFPMYVPFTFTTTTHQFSQSGPAPSIFWTYHDGNTRDGVALDYLGSITTPWGGPTHGGATLSLFNNSGTSLTSDLIPSNLDLASFPDGHSINIGGGENYFFSIDGNIDSIVRTPETSSTLLLLSLALLPILWLKSAIRPARG